MIKSEIVKRLTDLAYEVDLDILTPNEITSKLLCLIVLLNECNKEGDC